MFEKESVVKDLGKRDRGKKSSTFTTLVGKEVCDAFFEEEITNFKKNPNNIVMDFKTSVEESLKIDDSEYHIWKRRQRTKDGAENPKNPCDDKGLPIYLDKEGNITTKADENTPLWGDWINGSEKKVSVSRTISIPKRCWADKLRPHYKQYPKSIEQAQDVIDRDKKHHDKQQAKRKNKVQVEYDTRLVKEEVTQPQWTCKVNLEKVRDFPSTWKDVNYDPLKIPDKNPIILHFKWKKFIEGEEGKKGKWKTTGAGNFRGKKRIKETVSKGELFASKPLLQKLEEFGFQQKGFSFFERNNFKLPVPRTNDYCVVKAYELSEGFPFAGSMHRLGIDLSRGIPISTAGFFRTVDFSIEKGVQTLTDEEIKKRSEDPSLDAERFIASAKEKKKFFKYEKKAPRPTVELCHGVFNQLAKDSIIEFSDEITTIYS